MHELLVAFLIGVSSSGHCLMMCGGIASSLSSNVKQHAFLPRMSRTLLFHIGRISCYASLGFIIGDVLRLAISTSPTAIFYSRLFAGLMLIVIGFYVLGFGGVARFIESRMAFVWQKLQPVVRHFMGVQSYSDAYAIGYLWGFLPCGILYSTLLWASSQVGGTSAALLMLFFGLGTIPALFFSGVLAQKLLSGRSKKVMGIALIIFGVWTMAFMVIGHGDGHGHHASPQHEMPTQQALPEHAHGGGHGMSTSDSASINHANHMPIPMHGEEHMHD